MSPVRVVSYRVAMPRPTNHYFEIEAKFPNEADFLDVAMPVWTPGSYLVREYARHVQALSAVDALGAPLAFRRIDKASVRIAANGGPVTLRYRVYANDLSVRTSHLDATHGYFNGATLFFYAVNLLNQPHRVRIEAPAGWRTFGALEQDGADFVAQNYDALVDAPFEIGPHEAIAFNAASVPHRAVVWGKAAISPKKLADDFRRIIEVEADLWGGLPTSNYLFLIYVSERARGGLEHANSTSLIFPRSGFGSPRGWEDFLTLVAHEYFHLWNVKRLRPRAFIPFDYSGENYTTLLWYFEGATSYYDSLVVRRSGLMTPARYLTRLGETITMLESTPGRRVQSLADASTLAWIKHYRPDENSVNSAISYYVKGEVVSFLLDLQLRRATQGAKSLDDLLRLLWQRYQHSGVPEDGIEEAASELAGTSLASFFDHAVRSTDELDYAILEDIGLTLQRRPRESSTDKGGTAPRGRGDRPRGWTGILPKSGQAIAAVLDSSPAMDAGLSPDDDIVALDGIRCDAAALVARCDERQPGEVVSISFFRGETLSEAQVTLGKRPSDMVWLERVPSPTRAQQDNYARWIGAAWDAES